MKNYMGITLLLLSGCASWGHPDYGCSGLPDGITCIGTRDLYDATNGGEVPSTNSGKQPDNRAEQEDQDDVHPAHPAETAQPPATDPVIDTFVTPYLPDRPVPVRTPARVMRIWVSTWEDVKSGALIAPGYIYTEIEPRKWVIGHPERAANAYGRIFKPLEKTGITQY